jgi:hypothetical protein
MDLVNNFLTVIFGVGTLGLFAYMNIKGHINRKRAEQLLNWEWSRMKYRCLCDMRKVYNE